MGYKEGAYDFISIKNLGVINDGKEEVRDWGDAFENYTFWEKDGSTELIVEMGGLEENKEMTEMLSEVSEAWPKSLQILKELSEKS